MRSPPGASHVAAQVAAGRPAVYGGRREYSLVAWCRNGPVGCGRGACDLRRQCGACEQDLFHAETLPRSQTGAILLQNPPFAVAARPQLSTILSRLWPAADLILGQPKNLGGGTARA